MGLLHSILCRTALYLDLDSNTIRHTCVAGHWRCSPACEKHNRCGYSVLVVVLFFVVGGSSKAMYNNRCSVPSFLCDLLLVMELVFVNSGWGWAGGFVGQSGMSIHINQSFVFL